MTHLLIPCPSAASAWRAAARWPGYAFISSVPANIRFAATLLIVFLLSRSQKPAWMVRHLADAMACRASLRSDLAFFRVWKTFVSALKQIDAQGISAPLPRILSAETAIIPYSRPHLEIRELQGQTTIFMRDANPASRIDQSAHPREFLVRV